MKEALAIAASRIPISDLAQLVRAHPMVADLAVHPRSSLWRSLWHGRWGLKQRRVSYKDACAKRLKRMALHAVKCATRATARKALLLERNSVKAYFEKVGPTLSWPDWNAALQHRRSVFAKPVPTTSNRYKYAY